MENKVVEIVKSAERTQGQINFIVNSFRSDDEYKNNKLAKLDAEIVEIINDTVKKVVGKIIPMEEHKKLIISALEEAKREYIL
mgnify:CR=1 FL=1